MIKVGSDLVQKNLVQRRIKTMVYFMFEPKFTKTETVESKSYIKRNYISWTKIKKWYGRLTTFPCIRFYFWNFVEIHKFFNPVFQYLEWTRYLDSLIHKGLKGSGVLYVNSVLSWLNVDLNDCRFYIYIFVQLI